MVKDEHLTVPERILDVQAREDGKKSDQINKEKKSSVEMLEDEQSTVPGKNS